MCRRNRWVITGRGERGPPTRQQLQLSAAIPSPAQNQGTLGHRNPRRALPRTQVPTQGTPQDTGTHARTQVPTQGAPQDTGTHARTQVPTPGHRYPRRALPRTQEPTPGHRYPRQDTGTHARTQVPTQGAPQDTGTHSRTQVPTQGTPQDTGTHSGHSPRAPALPRHRGAQPAAAGPYAQRQTHRPPWAGLTALPSASPAVLAPACSSGPRSFSPSIPAPHRRARASAAADRMDQDTASRVPSRDPPSPTGHPVFILSLKHWKQKHGVFSCRVVNGPHMLHGPGHRVCLPVPTKP